MKAKGHWAGDSFQLYLRKHAIVIAPYIQAAPIHEGFVWYTVMDVPWGQPKRVRFKDNPAIQALKRHTEDILAIRESEELADEAICLGHMVSSDAPLY